MTKSKIERTAAKARAEVDRAKAERTRATETRASAAPGRSRATPAKREAAVDGETREPRAVELAREEARARAAQLEAEENAEGGADRAGEGRGANGASPADASEATGATADDAEASTTRKNGHPVAGAVVSGLRNLSRRSGRKGGDAFELSRSGRASRKSTRKSQGRLKRTTNLQLRAEREAYSPKARAGRAHG